MNAGALHGLAQVVSVPPAASIASRIIGMRKRRSGATLNVLRSSSPSSTYVWLALAKSQLWIGVRIRL